MGQERDGAQSGNGLFHAGADPDLDLADEDAPLDASEEAAAALEATAEAEETLAERIVAVVEDLPGVRWTRDGEALIYQAGGHPFAVLLPDVLEAALDPVVADAALRTPGTLASPRGAGWVAFAPRVIDRFALDRAEAWVRSAHRRVTGG